MNARDTSSMPSTGDILIAPIAPHVIRLVLACRLLKDGRDSLFPPSYYPHSPILGIPRIRRKLLSWEIHLHMLPIAPYFILSYGNVRLVPHPLGVHFGDATNMIGWLEAIPWLLELGTM